MDKRHKVILVLVILVAIVLVIFTGNQRFYEVVPAPLSADPQSGPAVSEQSPGYVTDPNRYFAPETAIDTTELPNLVFKASDSPETPLPVYQIAPKTYMFFGNIAQVDKYNRGSNGNAGFVITSEGVVVIDSLGTPRLGQRLINTITSITDKPITHLIITHNHPDHSYGAIAFRRLGGVTIISHEGVLDYMDSETSDASVQYRREMMPDDMVGFEMVRPDVLIGGERFSSQTITSGDRTFVLYNTGKHHSYGDLVVYQVEDKIVWISDLAFNQRTTFMGDGNSKQIIEAQDWLAEKFANAALMVPGHGSAQTGPFPMVEKTRSYVARLREVMARAIEEGLGMQEAIDQADFPDWHASRLYDENHRRNAHFVYQEMEQELF
ncbi:MAG: MBL fold metallo-hydrolase [Gammaproteobacteria bacterium]|nr:MBL fold metallo-hydrolase [Gammaproteobacteria bacterium]